MASQDHGIHLVKECVPEGSDYFQKDYFQKEVITFIHSRNVCQKEVITFRKIPGRAHTRICSNHSKRKEDGKINLSPSKEDPSSDEEYKELNS